MRAFSQKLLAVWVITFCTAFTLFSQNDLSLNVATGSGTVAIGDTVTFTIKVYNQGATNVTGVQVTNLLPSGASFVSASPGAGTYDSGTHVWNIGNISSATDSVSMTLALVITGEGVQTLQSNITSMTEFDGDSDPTNASPLEDDYSAACVTSPFNYCSGDTIDITATAPAGYTTYQWTKDGVDISGATSQTYNITEAGAFNYRVDGGAVGVCSSGSCCDIVVAVLTRPTAGITNNTGTTELTCNTTSISLTATGGGTYLWSTSDTTTNLSVTTPGTYTVTVTAANGCTATAQTTITQDVTPPTAGITNNTGTTELTCNTTSISLTATGGGTYLWSTSDTTTNLTVTTPGTYTLTVTAANGCTATAQTTITQDVTPPTAGINNNDSTTVITCIQTSISLTATGGGTYLWSTTDTTANISVTAAGTYTVTVTAANGCTATAQEVITGECTIDYADLPDGTAGTGPGDYQTTSANGGPSHGIIDGLSLGTQIDAEADGQPTANGDGDDTDGTNDDDGVVVGPTYDIVPGGTIRVPVTVTNTTGNTAYLVAWIDWNGDGDFDDPGEQVISINDGTVPFPEYLEIPIPSTATTGTDIGFIIRLSNTEPTSPGGYLSSGEVESYLIDVNCPTQICLPVQTTKN